MEIFLLSPVVFLLGLCWGSFLACFAYRISSGRSIFAARSTCPGCGNMISWYDNIPLASWLALRGCCRKCKGKISIIYPGIEFAAAGIVLGLFLKHCPTPIPQKDILLAKFFDGGFMISRGNCYPVLPFFTDFLFCSLLIVNSATDLFKMVIARIFSIWVVPVGWMLSYFSLTGISFFESIVASLTGYAVLFITSAAYKFVVGRDGIGEGDMEFLALIGSFSGLLGIWSSLMFGSVLGFVVGVPYLIFKKSDLRSARIPFGPFLAIGALGYIFFGKQIASFIL
jgi:leader peptidase (prepilin peptidase) / N-methyltransferase